ncbi:unnamed protein product, partial [marine sediment metagenome]
ELKQYKEGELTIDDINDNIDLPFFEISLTTTIKKVADQIIEIIRELVEHS